jgi:hypothetical protein
MKKGMRAIGALIAVFIVFLAIVIMVNFFDQSLDPQIPVLKAKESRIVPTTGGAIRLGLFWDDPDWQQKAHDILVGRERYDQAPRNNLKIETVFFCRKHDYRCNQEDLAQEGSAIKTLLQSADPLLKRYELLLDADSYFNPFDRSPQGAFQGTLISPWLNLAKAFHLSLYFKKPSQAVPLLLKEAKLFRQMADGPDTLLGHLVTLSLLDQNVQMLKDFIKQEPGLKKTLKPESLDLYRSLSVQDISVQAFSAETFRDLQLVDLIQQHPDGASMFSIYSNEKIDRFLGRLSLLLLRPIETQNILFHSGQAYVKNECWLPEKVTLCQKLDEDMQKQFSPLTLVNPTGRALARIVAPKYSGFWQKIRLKTEKIRQTAQEI